VSNIDVYYLSESFNVKKDFEDNNAND